MVGVVMGIHAFAYMLINDISFSPIYLVTYFPVSALYILSMAIGYFGLRYIELSISSPNPEFIRRCNSYSNIHIFTHVLSYLEVGSIVLITTGIVALAFGKRSSDVTAPWTKRIASTKKDFSNYLPILYCIIDGLGTFADAIYLDELALIGEDQALLAYEFTFFIVAIIAIIYLVAKKEKISLVKEKDRGIAAIFETADILLCIRNGTKRHYSSSVVASYSTFSVLLSRVFLKEKLTRAQYFMIALVMLGIALLAISEVI